MTDNLKPLNMHGHANTWEEELLEVTRERDELRAEVERLRKFQQEIFEVWGGNYEPEGRLADLNAVIKHAWWEARQTE